MADEEFVFVKNDSIGLPSAEEDEEFLNECFVDLGDLKLIQDTRSPHCIIVGRTGSGKSALLQRLSEVEEKVIQIDPEQLSLNYLANSTILPKLEEMGVDLDLFYRTLWRHIFAVEFIKARYNPSEAEGGKNFINRIVESIFGDEKKKRALEYLDEFGTSFWKETEVRVQEISKHFEAEINEQIGVSFGTGSIALAGKQQSLDKQGVTEKQEIVRKAQEIVAQKQLTKLSGVIEVLKEVFATPQPRYYIVIDRLDEKWVVEKFRYRLIRALIETLRDFRKVPAAKVIIALRRDLLQHVVRMTRDTGFQEEKFESLYLPIIWEKDQLLDLLDKRVKTLVRRRYTKKDVGWADLLPTKAGHKAIDKYLVERTQYRPRDIIDFFNQCISKALGNARISANMLSTAEAEYSRRRLRALGDEWQREYPLLLEFVALLQRRPAKFRVRDFTDDQISHLCLTLVARTENATDEVGIGAFKHSSGELDVGEMRRRICKMLHVTGVIGLQLEPKGVVVWTFRQRPNIGEVEILEENFVEVCPMFYRVLGIDSEERQT